MIRLTDFQRRQILQRIAAGEDVREIAADFDMAEFTIQRIAANAGSAARRTRVSAFKAQAKHRYRQSLQDLQAGVPVDQVAKTLGMHPASIRRFARYAGITLQQPRKLRTATAGTMNVHHLDTGIYAFIPVPILRAAGLLDHTQLHVRVEGATLIITAAPPAPAVHHRDTEAQRS